MVNLARLTETTSILPVVLYSCTQLSVRELSSGTVHSDGGLDILDRGDLERCLEARTQLAVTHLPVI